MNENEAFFQLVDRYKGNNAIFIADRNYESFNGFEHVVQSGNKYLIRVKDIGSKTSITQSFGPFEDTEFDIDVFSQGETQTILKLILKSINSCLKTRDLIISMMI